jgi:sugar lactone lactonase YvrE
MPNNARNLALTAIACVGLSIVTFNSNPASAWNRGPVETFAVLPAGAPKIEGLTVGNDGNVYVSTFDPTGTAAAQLFVFKKDGKPLRNVTIGGASPATLGLAFHPTTGTLLVVDFGAGNVRAVDPVTGASSVCITVTSPPVPPGLNALTFDAAGNTYISDSSGGIIWKKSGPGCGAATVWASDPLLLPTGVPPFGANGLGFNKAGTTLFVANTATDSLIAIPVSGGTAGAAQAFTQSINGADGIVLDDEDNIWVVANQSDEIVIVDPTGKVIAKLGDFNGLKHGVTRGLLFPASPDFSQDGKWLYVTNLELDLRSIGGPQTVDSQWAAQVQQHSIAKIRAKIPHIQDDDNQPD